MLELTTTPQADGGAEAERIPLFSIDGTVYSIPKEIDATVVLRLLKSVRKNGELAATAEMFEEVIGAEAYEALCNFKGMKASQLRQLIDDMTTYVLGQAEGLTGNS